MDARQFAVQLTGRRQPSGPPLNHERPDRRRLRHDSEDEAVVRRRVGVDGDQSSDLGVTRLVLVRAEGVGRLRETRWVVVDVDDVQRHGGVGRERGGPAFVARLHANFHLHIHIYTYTYTGLQWRQPVEFKVATLVHQALYGHVPSHLADDCCLVTVARPRRLRSADTRTLLVSRTRTNFGSRAFGAARPRVWNTISTELGQQDMSYSRFRQSLKTLLIRQQDCSVTALFNTLTY